MPKSAGALVAVNQDRMSTGDARPAGVRVFNPDQLETPPVDINQFVPEGHREAAREVLSMKRDERVAVAAALRAAGAKPGRIAQLLGVSLHTVRDYLACAREQGGLDDVIRDIEFRHVPQAVDNLGHFLEKRDKEVTLEVLKGRGIFRTFGNTKQEGGVGGGMNLTVNFVNAPQDPHVDPLKQVAGSTGEIVGAPNR